MKDYRHRYAWIVADGKRLQIIDMTEDAAEWFAVDCQARRERMESGE